MNSTEEIDINKALFQDLKQDYENAKKNNQYHKQFTVGFDYIEALVKLFGTIVISVVKSKDEELYKKLIKNDFQLYPSLGNYINLIKNPFSKNNKKILLGDPLYDFLYTQFTKNKKEGTYSDIVTILDGTYLLKTNKSNIQTTKNLLEKCVTTFRNKTRGHGASFREGNEDSTFRENILSLLDIIIKTLEIDFQEILKQIKFFKKDIVNSRLYNIDITYESTTIELVPILAYIACDHQVCQKEHRHKLFFYNGGKESSPEFLDHSFSHVSMVESTSTFYRNIETFQSQVIMSKQAELLNDFVGRKDEINSASKHVKNNTNSLMQVYGKPGIGKSAYLTQLEEHLHNDLLESGLNSFIFYAIKDKMDVEEDKFFFGQINSYFNALGITPKFEENENLKRKFEKLFDAYEKNPVEKKLLLIIDGLDEFADPISIINIIPFNFTNKIHLVLSYRPFNKIIKSIDEKIIKTQGMNELSIELGRLNNYEVEDLLSRVIPREIDIESEEYSTIVDTIANRTDGLPLYIYFVVQKLKEIKKSKDIAQEIITWSTKLPEKLESFYQEVFIEIKPLAREILYLVYLSKTGIDLNTLYDILAEENDEIDEVLFTQEYFNLIEIFLKYDKEGNFVFYHLSVKEAILEYQKNQASILTYNLKELTNVLYESIVDHYEEKLKSIEYIKDKSTIYKVLTKSIKYSNSNKKEKYSQNNLIHLLNTQVWTHIYHTMIDYKNMKSMKYTSIMTAELSSQNKDEIKQFFNIIDTKESQMHRYEIRYGYELAFLLKDYSQVLVYKDMYEDYIQNIFLDISLNIDKPEFIQRFIDYKSEWLQAINYKSKDFFVNIISQQERLNDDFYEILKFLDDKFKVKLAYKISRTKALEIINNIKYDKEWEIEYDESGDYKKQEALVLLSTQIAKYNIPQALEIIELISEEYYKLKALALIENLNSNITQRNNNNINKVLKKLEYISDDWDKSEALINISSQVKDKYLLKKILLDINHLYNNEYKANVLFSIIHLFTKFNLNTALYIADNIPIAWRKTASLNFIVTQTNNKKILKKALKIAGKTSKNLQSDVLANILFNINDKNFFKKALRLEKEIDDEEDKLHLLASIAFWTSKYDIKKALNMAYDIIDDVCKSYALSSIAAEITKYNLKKALKVADNISDSQSSGQVLTSISRSIMNSNPKKSLKIINKISNEQQRSRALIYFLTKIKNQKLSKHIHKIINNLSTSKEKAEALILISSHTGNKNLLLDAIEIAQSISNCLDQSKVLELIAIETVDTIILKKIFIMSINIPNSMKQNLLSILNSKLTVIDSLIYSQLLTTEVIILDTLNTIKELAPNTILEYYNIKVEDKIVLSKLQILLSKLNKLHIGKLDKKIKRKKFNGIKEKILKNKTVLHEFISIYGDNLEIEDSADFEDVFVFKNLEKVRNVTTFS